MKKLIFTLATLSTININAQKEDIKYAAFNVVSGGITSSAIACFNKPKGQKLGKTFIQSFWKGCLGGSLNYTGKKLIQASSINNTYAYVWPGRIVHSLGSSMIYNGAKNEKLFSSVSMDVFFTHLSYDGKLHCQVDPITLGSAIIFSFNKDISFNFKNTLATGSMFFNQRSDTFTVAWSDIYKYGLQGQAIGNTLKKKKCNVYDYIWSLDSLKLPNNEYLIIPKITPFIKTIDKNIALHEIIHTFQYFEYNTFNILYLDKIKTNLTKYVNVNLNFGAIYLIANLKGYKNNPFEKEANYFGYNN